MEFALSHFFGCFSSLSPFFGEKVEKFEKVEKWAKKEKTQQELLTPITAVTVLLWWTIYHKGFTSPRNYTIGVNNLSALLGY